MTSPVLALQNSIAASAFNMAPERAPELARWRDGGKFHLVLTTEAGFRIRVTLAEHAAILPIASLEYLWCASHAFFILASEYAEVQRTGVRQFEMGASARAAPALAALKWAAVNMRTGKNEPWPRGLPAPALNGDSNIKAANELFLAAIAWIILHEIAHVTLGHGLACGAYSLQQERAADRHAINWTLSMSNVPAESKKRMYGIATALLAMQLLHQPGEPATTRDTHPSPVERLNEFLEQARVPDNDSINGYIATVLQFQLAQYGLRPSLDGDSIREIVSGFLVAFARNA